MHMLDSTNYTARNKFRVRGKWELVLVLVVVLAGIAVTVVAVVKAKEKRDSYEDGAEGRLAVINSSPGLQNSRQIKLSSIPISSEPNMIMTRKPLLGNRYQAEQEFAESTGINSKLAQPYSKQTHRLQVGSPSGPVRSGPRVSTKLVVDGLPGYPSQVNIDPNMPWINEKHLSGLPLHNSAGYALDDLDTLASHEVSEPVAPMHHSAETPTWQHNSKHFNRNTNQASNQLKANQPQYGNIFEQLGLVNGNYISTRELMWLQRNRPELFQGGSNVQAVMPARVHARVSRVRRNAPTGKRRKKQLVDEENEVNRRYLEFDDQPSDQGEQRRQIKQGNRYSEHEHRRPSKKRSLKKQNKKGDKSKNRYNKGESKNVEKYDILGSGNFEIIRGGILDKYDDRKLELQKSSNVVTNDKVNEQNRQDVNHESEEDEEDNNKSHNSPNNDNNQNTPDTFEPFNFDIFKNDPLFSNFGGV